MLEEAAPPPLDGEAEPVADDGRLSAPGVCGELDRPAAPGTIEAQCGSLVLIVPSFMVPLCGFQMRRLSS